MFSNFTQYIKAHSVAILGTITILSNLPFLRGTAKAVLSGVYQVVAALSGNS